MPVTYLHEGDVELLEEEALLLQGVLIGGQLDDEIDDVVADAIALLTRKHFPPVLNHLLEDGEGEELGALRFGLLQDLIDPRPGLRMLLQLCQQLTGLITL